MIDERALTDPSRCPSCGAPVTATERCSSCGVSLRSETALKVWQASIESAAALERRRALIEQLRAQAQVPVPTTAAYLPPPGYFTGSGYDSPPAAPGLPPPRQPPAPTPAPAPSGAGARMRDSLGVLLLAVAAVIFLVVSWGVLGVGGRATVMSVFTLVAAAGATVAARRGLTATAEAVALLTVGLGLLDAYGARSAGLANLDASAGLAYWAGALAMIALVAGAWSVLLPLRSLRLAAAVLGQLPGWLLALHWSDGAVHPAAIVATVLTVQAVIGIALVLAWPFSGTARDARWAVVVGAVAGWTVAAVTAAAAAYGTARSCWAPPCFSSWARRPQALRWRPTPTAGRRPCSVCRTSCWGPPRWPSSPVSGLRSQIWATPTGCPSRCRRSPWRCSR